MPNDAGTKCCYVLAAVAVAAATTATATGHAKSNLPTADDATTCSTASIPTNARHEPTNDGA